MHAVQTARAYTKRFLGLGWARVFLVLGIVFSLLALASPIWSYSEPGAGPNGSVTRTFGWTTVTSTHYQSGVWTSTVIESYTAPGFSYPVIANSVGASYVLIVVVIVLLIAAIALFSSWFSLHLQGISLLIVGLIVVVLALAAVFYPLLTVPSSAATDLGNTAVTGFWGSSGPTSWGAGLGWWLLLVGALLGILGGIWPFLKGMRQPMLRAPPPREWQVER